MILREKLLLDGGPFDSDFVDVPHWVNRVCFPLAATPAALELEEGEIRAAAPGEDSHIYVRSSARPSVMEYAGVGRPLPEFFDLVEG